MGGKFPSLCCNKYIKGVYGCNNNINSYKEDGWV